MRADKRVCNVLNSEVQGVRSTTRDAKNITPGVTEWSNDAGISIGGAGVSYAEKAARTPMHHRA